MKNFIKNHKKISVGVLIVICIISVSCIYNQVKINNQIQRNIQDRKDKQLKENLNNVVDNYKKEAKDTNDTLDEQLADLDKYRLIITDTKETNYSGGYHDIEITVKNVSSENINYVKIGLDFMNENGDIIQSDWTNDNSVIKPKSQQTISKKVSDKIKYKTVKPEIQEVK